MARIDHGQPPWSWLLRLGGVRASCWRLYLQATRWLVGGKALFHETGRTTPSPDSVAALISVGQGPGPFQFFGPGPTRRRCQLAGLRTCGGFDPTQGQFFAGRFPWGPISAMP